MLIIEEEVIYLRGNDLECLCFFNSYDCLIRILGRGVYY